MERTLTKDANILPIFYISFHFWDNIYILTISWLLFNDQNPKEETLYF